MPHINLLPWREQQRQASQQKFLILIGSIVGVSLFVMYLIGSFYDSLRTGQEIKNNGMFFNKKQISVNDLEPIYLREAEVSKSKINYREIKT